LKKDTWNKPKTCDEAINKKMAQGRDTSMSWKKERAEVRSKVRVVENP